jgi:hypothetical protein
MRSLFGMRALIVFFAISMAATSTVAAAMTCTDRQQVCFAYCEKNYGDSPRCRGVCGQLLSECMSTGCWESKVTAKRCGISRQ